MNPLGFSTGGRNVFWTPERMDAEVIEFSSIH
jgi:hypothetical protein